MGSELLLKAHSWLEAEMVCSSEVEPVLRRKWEVLWHMELVAALRPANWLSVEVVEAGFEEHSYYSYDLAPDKLGWVVVD